MPVLENQVGFNISNNKLQLVEVNIIENQFELVNVDEVYLHDLIDFENDDDKSISAQLQNAFNKLQIKNKLNSFSASFSLPFELFYSLQIPYDKNLHQSELLNHIKWELSIIYPFINLNNLVIQYFVIEKNEFNLAGSILVFALDRKYLQMLETFCIKNNLTLKFVDNVHLSSNASLFLSNSASFKGLSLSIYQINNLLSIFFMMNENPFYYKLINFNNFDEISEKFTNAFKNSTLLNIQASQIESAFLFNNDIPFALADVLKKTIGLNFIEFNPFDKIRPSSKLYENILYLEKFNSFTSAAGIAIRIT